MSVMKKTGLRASWLATAYALLHSVNATANGIPTPIMCPQGGAWEGSTPPIAITLDPTDTNCSNYIAQPGVQIRITSNGKNTNIGQLLDIQFTVLCQQGPVLQRPGLC